MVKILCGAKGTGKTKRLIEMANKDAKNCNGDIVFIEVTNKHIYDLCHDIRYINAMEFDIKSIETFHGFLNGMIAEDYDIENIYIDNLYRIIDIDFDVIKALVEKLDKISNNFGTSFIFSVNWDRTEIPEALRGYILE